MSDEEIEGEGFVFKDSRSSQLSEDEALDQDSQAEAQKKDPTKEQATWATSPTRKPEKPKPTCLLSSRPSIC